MDCNSFSSTRRILRYISIWTNGMTSVKLTVERAREVFRARDFVISPIAWKQQQDSNSLHYEKDNELVHAVK